MTEKKEVSAETTEKVNLKKRLKIQFGNHGKKYIQAIQQIEVSRPYSVNAAFELLLKIAYAKFDETIDVAFNLGVDPKHADQMVRGAVVLPHGIGKVMRVAVLAKGEKAKDATAAGADFVGADELIEKIAGGWFEFDKMIATPDMMVAVSKIGKILGPRGLMPNPKLGTVTFDVTKAVKEQKLGKIEYRTEKTGIIHVGIGKRSFGVEKLRDNFISITGVILKAKPPTSKGTYMRGISLSATMTPSILLDTADVLSVVSAG